MSKLVTPDEFDAELGRVAICKNCRGTGTAETESYSHPGGCYFCSGTGRKLPAQLSDAYHAAYIKALEQRADLKRIAGYGERHYWRIGLGRDLCRMAQEALAQWEAQ